MNEGEKLSGKLYKSSGRCLFIFLISSMTLEEGRNYKSKLNILLISSCFWKSILGELVKVHVLSHCSVTRQRSLVMGLRRKKADLSTRQGK